MRWGAGRLFDLLSADTDQTPDAGKDLGLAANLCHRQGGVSRGRRSCARPSSASPMPETMRHQSAGGRDDVISEARAGAAADLRACREIPRASAALEEATFDPPTSALDANGQAPYAVFGFGAHLAEIEVDRELGTMRC